MIEALSKEKSERGSTPALALLSAAIIWSCSVPPESARMVPEAVSISAKPSGRTIRVIAVTEGGPTSSKWEQGAILQPFPEARINDDTFRKALIDTLRRSGLFKEVVSSGDSDYELSATLFAQKVSTLGWGWVTATLGVRYALTRAGSKSPLWIDSLVTACDSSSGLSAITIESEANECAMKKNLERMLKQLARPGGPLSDTPKTASAAMTRT